MWHALGVLCGQMTHTSQQLSTSPGVHAGLSERPTRALNDRSRNSVSSSSVAVFISMKSFPRGEGKLRKLTGKKQGSKSHERVRVAMTC